MTDDRPAVPASMPWRGTGQARANSAARDAKPPVEAAAAAAHAFRVAQARQLLDDVAAGLPEGDPLRVAIERGRKTVPPSGP